MNKVEKPEYKPKSRISLTNPVDAIGAQKAQMPSIEDRAQTSVNKTLGYNQEIIELINAVAKTLGDKKLPDMKTQPEKEIELKQLSDLLGLAKQMNEDPEVADLDNGTMALFSFLYKIVFAMKDKLNKLEYELNKSNQVISNLRKELGS